MRNSRKRMHTHAHKAEDISPLANHGMSFKGGIGGVDGQFLRVLFQKCEMTRSSTDDEYFLIASLIPVSTSSISPRIGWLRLAGSLKL